MHFPHDSVLLFPKILNARPIDMTPKLSMITFLRFRMSCFSHSFIFCCLSAALSPPHPHTSTFRIVMVTPRKRAVSRAESTSSRQLVLASDDDITLNPVGNPLFFSLSDIFFGPAAETFSSEVSLLEGKSCSFGKENVSLLERCPHFWSGFRCILHESRRKTG